MALITDHSPGRELSHSQMLKPVGHIWAKSVQPWMKLHRLVYQTQPDDNYQTLIDAFAKPEKGR